MPPCAAPLWERTGWTFEITATSAPRARASSAARIPASPAPTTRTSRFTTLGKRGGAGTLSGSVSTRPCTVLTGTRSPAEPAEEGEEGVADDHRQDEPDEHRGHERELRGDPHLLEPVLPQEPELL